MKTRRWIAFTVLAWALSMPASSVRAATDINPAAAGVDIHRSYHHAKLQAASLSATAQGTVLRQGTPARPTPGGGTLACSQVKIIPSISSPVFTMDRSVLANFEISLANPSAGVYTIQAGYSGYLASEAGMTIPPSGDVGTTALCGGDVNADRIINILDIGQLIGKFGRCNVTIGSSNQTTCNSAGSADEPTDINDDGCVNISDLTIAAGNLGHIGPTRWDTAQCGPK